MAIPFLVPDTAMAMEGITAIDMTVAMPIRHTPEAEEDPITPTTVVWVVLNKAIQTAEVQDPAVTRMETLMHRIPTVIM